MPVYHVSNFDVSAVQIDLSSNIFADTLVADYWVKKVVTFNDSNTNSIKIDASLNDMFKAVFSGQSGDYVGTTAVYRNSSGTRGSYVSPGTLVTGVQFKDLGVIKASDHSLYSSSIYTDVSNLVASNNDTTSFNGKARAALQALDPITGLREKMMASYNSGGFDRSIDQTMPTGAQFGFKVVRNLNLPGTSEDRQIFIGIILEQS
jgi:hypothetical protein